MAAMQNDEFGAKLSVRIRHLPGDGWLRASFEDLDLNEVEQLMGGYYRTYYSELNTRTSRYPAKSNIFPDVLQGPRRIAVTIALDGVLVFHWPAQQQSFEFRSSSDAMVMNLAKSERTLSAPSGMSVEVLGDYHPGTDFGAVEVWRTEVEEAGVIVKSDWMRVDTASLDTLDAFLDEAQARENAEQDVQVAADAYLMGLAPAPPGKEQQDRVIAELESAIEEFEEVLESRANDEKMIQYFLEAKRNQILLDPSALSIRPQVKLGAEYVPDFAIEVAEQQYVLIEIERPALPLLTKKGRPTAELTHAQQQLEDWFEWISRHSEYARELLPGVREPKGWVVMGRRSTIPPEHKNVLARGNAESRRITTMTYDDLLDRARQHLENLRGL